MLKCQARRRKRTSARPKFTVTSDLHIFVPIVILFQKFKCCFILDNQTPQLTQPFSNSKDILWYKNIVNIYVLINLYQSIVVNHTYLKDWNIPTTCIILYGFVANLRRQQLELLPTIAYYCLLLPTIANFCQLLPTIAYYCQLLPTIAYYCQLLPILPTIAYYCLLLPNYCQLLPTIAHYCQLLPAIANFCLLSPILVYYGQLLQTIPYYCQHSIANLRTQPGP